MDTQLCEYKFDENPIDMETMPRYWRYLSPLDVDILEFVFKLEIMVIN